MILNQTDSKARVIDCSNVETRDLQKARAEIRLRDGNKNAARVMKRTDKNNVVTYSLVYPWMLADIFSI